MAETRAHQRLKKAWPRAHWQRFESWTGIGVFDTNGCHNGQEIWVEFKEVIPPKSLTDAWVVKPKVRPSQIAWEALKRHAGGVTYVAIMVGPAMYIIHGCFLKPLREFGIPLGIIKEQNIPIEEIFRDAK